MVNDGNILLSPMYIVILSIFCSDFIAIIRGWGGKEILNY